MKKKTFAALALTAALAVPGVASAAPADNAECRRQVRALAIAASEEGSYGDFMSDTIFGNEPNIEDGHVVPSLTPGPASMSGGFYTGGDWQAFVRAACNA